LVTPPRNQFVPSPCGSCWAHAATGALSDRIKLNTYYSKGGVPWDVNLAPQYLLDCGMYGASNINAGSCYGGSALLGYALIKETGISDESCDPYIGSSPSHFSEVTCDQMMCRTCNRFGTCYLVTPEIRVYVDEYGMIDYENLPNSNMTMEEHMRAEIYSRGPIVCSMYAHADAFENYTSGIIVDNTKYNGTTHDLVLLGWGYDEESQLNYWIGRNSFGTLWGEQGFFYAQRGVDIFNMEQYCFWATPKN